MAPEGRLGADRAVYRVTLDVQRDGSESNWNDGSNVRWVALQRSNGGWSVADLATSPITSADGSTASQAYGRVGGVELGMTFEVPAWWQQDGSGYVWRTGSGGAVAFIGAEAYSPTQVPDDLLLLPRGWRSVARQPADLGWASGTQYLVDLGDTQQTHVVVRLGGKIVYDFFSSAPSNNAAAATSAEEARTHLLNSIVLIGG